MDVSTSTKLSSFVCPSVLLVYLAIITASSAEDVQIACVVVLAAAPAMPGLSLKTCQKPSIQLINKSSYDGCWLSIVDHSG